MRFVVYGAGSVGGVVGARLFQHGHDVVLIARGAHLDAMRASGLRLQDPSGEQTLPIPTVDHPGKIDWSGDEVCLVAVKSQHSTLVLAELACVAPAWLSVVCLQNGVCNEPEALRRFAHVTTEHPFAGQCVPMPMSGSQFGRVSWIASATRSFSESAANCGMLGTAARL